MLRISVHLEEEELVDLEVLNIGMKHMMGKKFKKSMKSIVKVLKSVRQSAAPWEGEPESPPRKKARTSSSVR